MVCWSKERVFMQGLVLCGSADPCVRRYMWAYRLCWMMRCIPISAYKAELAVRMRMKAWSGGTCLG